MLATLKAQALARTASSKLDEVIRSSQHDALTNTPNRTMMRDRLESAITQARRHGTHIAVLFLDLDRFKQINDTLGHTIGDRVMQLVARRLASAVRDSDTVSRYGGDEFLILLNDISQASDAALIAAKMLADLAAPSRVGAHAFHLSASLGIAIHPEDGTDTATLIDRADSAMYRAKKRGGGRFEFYSHLTAIEPVAFESPPGLGQ
nr:GGDEF domain-containing protein [uncultured Halomonas sp.]